MGGSSEAVPAVLPLDVEAWTDEKERGVTPSRPLSLPPVGGIAPDQGLGAPAPSRAVTVSIQPPDYFPPTSATDFSPAFQFAGLTAVAGVQRPAALRFEVPPNNVAVIRDLNLNINNITPSTQVRWFIEVNGGPVAGWDALTILPRSAVNTSSSFSPESTRILVSEGGVIQGGFLVDPADAGTYDVGMFYHGWYFPDYIWTAYKEIEAALYGV